MDKSDYGFKPIKTEKTGNPELVKLDINLSPLKENESYSIKLEIDNLTYEQYKEFSEIFKKLKNKYSK